MFIMTTTSTTQANATFLKLLINAFDENCTLVFLNLENQDLIHQFETSVKINYANWTFEDQIEQYYPFRTMRTNKYVQNVVVSLKELGSNGPRLAQPLTCAILLTDGVWDQNIHKAIISVPKKLEIHMANETSKLRGLDYPVIDLKTEPG